MKKIRLLLLSVLAGLTMSSCIYETLYNTWHPDQSQLTVVTDWSNASSDSWSLLPYSITLTDIGGNSVSHPAVGLVNTLPLQEPGTYKMVVANNPSNEGVTVNGSVISVNLDPEDNSYLQTDFDFVFAGTVDPLVLEKDKDERVTVVMNQHVGIISFSLLLDNDPFIPTVDDPGGERREITEITATLSGIARTYNYSTNVYGGTPNTIKLPFRIGYNEAGQRVLVCQVNVLGTLSNEQNLNINIEFAHGEDYARVETNIYNLLAGLNLEKHVTKNVAGTVSFPLIAGGDATIEVWEQEGDAEDIILEDDIIADFVYQVGDYYPNNDATRAWGIVVETDGTNGTIMGKIADAPMQWSTVTTVGVGANDLLGMANTHTVLDYASNNGDGYTLADFPAFEWLVNTYNTGSGWYIPSEGDISKISALGDREAIEALLVGGGFNSLPDYWITSNEDDVDALLNYSCGEINADGTFNFDAAEKSSLEGTPMAFFNF